MPRPKKKKVSDMLELNMTAMCDVIFNLLIYLVLTAKPAIAYTNLDINRPQPDPQAKKEDVIPDLVEIMVFSDAYVVKGRRVNAKSLETVLIELGNLSKTQTILIKCTWDSPHEKLVQCLDLCAKAKLTNLSVMSM